MDDTPPDSETDSDGFLADLFRDRGAEREEDPDFLGLEPTTIDEPPPTGRVRRILVSGAATLAVASVLATALIIGTTGDPEADRVAQPVPVPAPRSSAPSPAPPPVPASPPAPSPGPEADEPTERAAVADDPPRNEDETPKPARAPDRPAPPADPPPPDDPPPAADVAGRDERPAPRYENLAEAAAQRRLDRFRAFVDRVNEFWGIDQ